MDQAVDIKELNERIQRESSFVDMVTMEMNKVIIGQKHLVESLLIGLLSNGHILLEGVPGLGKNIGHKIAGKNHKCKIFTNSVYTRFASG